MLYGETLNLKWWNQFLNDCIMEKQWPHPFLHLISHLQSVVKVGLGDWVHWGLAPVHHDKPHFIMIDQNLG